MKGGRTKWNRTKSVRPKDENEVETYLKSAHNLWDKLVATIPELKKVQDLDEKTSLPTHYRSEKGGDFLFRAIAFPIFAKCLVTARAFGIREELFIQRFAKVPRSLNDKPWMGVLWDGSNMSIGKKNQTVAQEIILWILNVDPGESKIKRNLIQKRLAEIMNKKVEEVSLPSKIF